MIQMKNGKFEDSAAICFWVMLITDTHTHTHTYTEREREKETDQTLKLWYLDSRESKRVNPFRKFDPKTILFLLIGKRK